MKPFLILETGSPIPSLRRHGSFGHWIRVAAGLHARQVHECGVALGAEPPDRRAYAGVLITGSGAMVSDREPWSERCADWLRDAAHAGMPLLGICYGHQLIAHALGGEVGYNPRGREMGTVPVTLHPSAADDPLFAGMGASIDVHATHLQTVLRAPAQATVLARSEADECQAFRWGEQVWGLQFHPEFSTRLMRGYIQARAEALAQEGRCHRQLGQAVRPAPQARRLLHRFVHHAHRAAHKGSNA